MRFEPFLENGVPVQVVATVDLHFKTSRPAGVETFETARTYFERGRKTGFPSAGTGTPYVLHAEFEAEGAAGSVATGRYEDTWISDSEWRRETWFDKSHYVRSRNGQKRYQFTEGPDAELLRLVLRALEPIPAMDTFQESDWRIKRDTVSGVQTVRVLTGYESPDGKSDPVQVRGYWFGDDGVLVKAYFKGLEMQRSEVQGFDGAMIAHQVDLLRDGALGMRIRITEVTHVVTVPSASTFEVRGHEWQRAFTDEVR